MSILHESLQEFVVYLAEKSVCDVQQPSASRRALLHDSTASFLKWGLGISKDFGIHPTKQGGILKPNKGHLKYNEINYNGNVNIF